MRRRFALLAALLVVLLSACAVGVPAPAPAAALAMSLSSTTGSTGSLLKPASTWSTYSNLRYSNATTSSANLLDLYVPNNGSTTVPLIIWVHGGGWYSGDKTDNMSYLAPVVKAGYAVASINYRLVNEAHWPAQIVDVRSAIRWLRANGATYRLWTPKLAIWGASAGGQLATMAALTAGNTVWDQGLNLGQSAAVQVGEDDYGPADLPAWSAALALPAPDSMITPLLGCQVKACPATALDASPVHWVSPAAAPLGIWYGTADITVPPAQDTELYNALKAAGAVTAIASVPGMGHGQPQYYTTAKVLATVQMFDGYTRP